MDRASTLLQTIQTRIGELNRAERKVAEVILQNPRQATRYTIAALAQAAQVSEPTVNRFCRSLGVSGYPEMKIQLAHLRSPRDPLPLVLAALCLCLLCSFGLARLAAVCAVCLLVVRISCRSRLRRRDLGSVCCSLALRDRSWRGG